MSALFSTLSCCWFWLLLGVLIGWLLNRWLCKCLCKPNHTHIDTTTTDKPIIDDKPIANAIADVSLASSAAPVNAIPAAKASTKTVNKVAALKDAGNFGDIVIDLAAAKVAGFALKNANDLTVVEGIGPKINELFNNAGVKTFAQLAKQSVPQMRAILDAGGSRFRIANPVTWAEQAALAAENKWTELKKLQDTLSGGVKK